MTLLIGFLTFIMVVNCLFLILLVLVQLPKKEAGAGLAFGAGAVDTLIGAGSGNALTNLTKYGATSFVALAILLSILNTQRNQSTTRNLERALSQKSSAAPMLNLPTPTAPTTGALSNSAALPPTNASLSTPPAPQAPVVTTGAVLSLPATPQPQPQ